MYCFSLDSNELRSALETIKPMFIKRSWPRPDYRAMVELTFDDKQHTLKVRARNIVPDYTGTIECTIKAYGENDKSFTVPFWELLRIVQAIPDSLCFHVERDDYPRLEVRSGSHLAVIKNIELTPLKGYLTWQHPEMIFATDIQSLADVFKDVSFACNKLSKKGKKPEWTTGIGFVLHSDDMLDVCGADGHRLAFRRIQVSTIDVFEKDVDFVVPRQLVDALIKSVKIHANKRGRVEVSLDDLGNVYIRTEKVKMIFPLLRDSSWAYEKLFPKAWTRIVANRKELIHAIRKVKTITQAVDVVITFDTTSGPDCDNLVITSQKEDIFSEIRIQSTFDKRFPGKKGMVRYNASYLLQILSKANADEITIELAGKPGEQPGAIYNGSCYKFVLMPMVLREVKHNSPT